MILRGLGYKGWIISFEPVRANFEVLQSVAAQHSPWRVLLYALGAVDCEGYINVTEDGLFSSFLTPKAESQSMFPKNRVEKTEKVSMRRLDSVLDAAIAGIPAPRIYLKMDTQGFDIEVLKGAESVLPTVLALQTEVSFRNLYEGMRSFAESIEEFRTRGFDVVDFLPVTRDPHDLGAIEMDCLLTRSTRQPPA